MENRVVLGRRCPPLFPRSYPPCFRSLLPRRFADWPAGPGRSDGFSCAVPRAASPSGSPCSDRRGQRLQACARCRLGSLRACCLAAWQGGLPVAGRCCVARARSRGRRSAAATLRSEGRRSASGSAPGAERLPWGKAAGRGRQVRSGRCAGSVLSGGRRWFRSPSPGPPLQCREPGRCGSGSRCSRSLWSGPSVRCR